ncbi:MAG: copper-binding protein [Planctomycetota bacterium]
MSPTCPRTALAARQAPPLTKRLAAALLLVASTAILTACDRGETPASDRPAPDAVITMRGRVFQPPQQPGGEFFVHHEAAPDWPVAEGPDGMAEMTMSFRGEQGVSLAGIAQGDAVEMTVAVRVQKPTYYVVTAITKLPRDTVFEIAGEGLPTVGAAATAPGTQPHADHDHAGHHHH